MTDSEIILFKTFAVKYLWWLTPDEALKRPERIVIQVMNLGDFSLDSRPVYGLKSVSYK